jgi:hypothetical protein
VAGRQSSCRLLFAVFMVFAFALQSYAVQTHIHERLTISAIGKATTATPDSKGGRPAPAKSLPDDCPLCQQLYGGQYIAPSALVFFLPMVLVRAIKTELGALPHYDAVSHNWRGRAPPYI